MNQDDLATLNLPPTGRNGAGLQHINGPFFGNVN
jgi:hypothetical protein